MVGTCRKLSTFVLYGDCNVAKWNILSLHFVKDRNNVTFEPYVELSYTVNTFMAENVICAATDHNFINIQHVGNSKYQRCFK